jgi:hypothetical protein
MWYLIGAAFLYSVAVLFFVSLCKAAANGDAILDKARRPQPSTKEVWRRVS